MALSLSAALSVSGFPAPAQMAQAKTVEKQTVQATEDLEEDENVYKVELDESGTIVSDNLADLENHKFSWDNATVYFVLTDRFKNGDPSNDNSYGRAMQADGKTPVAGLDYKTNPGTFHGGDLKGITSVVEEGYFNDLGVNAIWITAPYEQVHGYTSANVQSNNANTYPDPSGQGFPYYSYHGYWTLDYSNIDANMGTAEDFGKFVDACHERGIRVVMDVVMNHVGYTTMQDAVDYGFDGALKGDWSTYYYGNATYLMGGDPEATNYWDASSSAWSKWWGPGFVRADYPGYDAAGGDDTHMSLCGLPDVITESSAKEVPTPPLLVTKWTQEGRLAQEQGELDDFFSRTGYKKQPRYYIIKWLSDYVREYGVDGFRCDTAKHVDLDAWKDLKTECCAALEEWRENNPDKAGAQWTDDFWMTGEAWGHGMGKSPYHTSGGFDSMINFNFPKDGNLASIEGTYSSYAEAMNSDPDFNSLSYLASHDDSAGIGVFGSSNNNNMGTSLLLAPGGVQIYYGNENNRGLGWKDFFTGSDYLDQRYRTDMDFGANPGNLAHWQKVGTFRNDHISVGAGQHEMLSADPYTFSRTYNLEEDDEDKVVCCLPGKAGTYDVEVGDIFEDGETVTNAYTGDKATVSGGTVEFTTADSDAVILIEGSGIVKPSVNIKSKVKSGTYNAETFEVTLKANQAKDTTYSIDGGAAIPFVTGDVITLGGGTKYGEETVVTVNGISEADGSTLSKEVTFTRGPEPTVSAGELYLQASKADFPTAPNAFIYTDDTAETALNGAWPGAVMEEDDSGDYWCVTIPEYEDGACVILSLGATANSGGTWRSTPDKAKGLEIQYAMSYDKTSNAVTEMPSGEPGRLNISYVDENGNVLKEIYRVGAVGKKYQTYPAIIDGYSVAQTPDNAAGVFETESQVTYVYTTGNGGGGTVITNPPTAPSTGDNDTSNGNGNGNGVQESTTPPNTQRPGNNNTQTQAPNRTTAPTGGGNSSIRTASPATTAPVATTPGTNGGMQNGGNNNNATPTPTAGTGTSASPQPSVTPTASATAAPTNSEASQMSVSLRGDRKGAQAVNTRITLTASTKEGSGNYQYKFSVTKEGSETGKILSANGNKATWTPTVSGDYEIMVIVQDENTGKIATATLQYRILKNYFLLEDYTVNNSGKKISMKATARSSRGTVKYKYVIKRGKKTVKTYAYSTKTSRNLRVSKNGNYRVILYVKDGENKLCSSKSLKIS